mgnify:FL=1
MRKYILSVATFVLAIMALSSCLGGAEEVDYNDDAAISTFTLGTLNRYIHTKASDGSDSIYKSTKDCSTYAFSIDHAKGMIWNSDSLPEDIDAAHVVCTVNVKNSGSIGIKSATSDSLSAYKSTDSIDFRTPRVMYAYNILGTGYRKYDVHVNVHKEAGDSCVWTKVTTGNSQIAALSNMKALCLQDNVFLFGTANGSTKVYTTALNDGKNWTELATTPALAADASKNVLIQKGVFYCLSDGKVLTSADAVNWQTVGETVLKHLIAATSVRLYGIDAEGNVVSSSDNGVTWKAEELDDAKALFPTEGFSYACHTLRTDATAEKVVLIGNRSLESYPYDKYAMVWTKIDEAKAGSRTHAWAYNDLDESAKHNAPRAENWQIVNYDGTNLKGLCGKGFGKSTETAFSKVFHSGDDGITWLNDSIMKVPSDFSKEATAFAMTTDTANSIWIICGGTGDVWKTRINRLVWKKEDAWIKE